MSKMDGCKKYGELCKEGTKVNGWYCTTLFFPSSSLVFSHSQLISEQSAVFAVESKHATSSRPTVLCILHVSVCYTLVLHSSILLAGFYPFLCLSLSCAPREYLHLTPSPRSDTGIPNLITTAKLSEDTAAACTAADDIAGLIHPYLHALLRHPLVSAHKVRQLASMHQL